MLTVGINIACILILLLAAYAGYRHGILRSAVKLALMVASVLLAAFLAKNVGPTLAEKLPMPGVGTRLSSFVSTNLEKLEDGRIDTLLTDWGFSQRAANAISSFVESHAEETADSFSRKLTPAIDLLFTQVLVFAFLLLVFWLVTVLLTTLVDRALELKLLDSINRFLGLVFGLLCGIVALYVLAFAASWCLPLVDATLDLNLAEPVNQSFVLRLFNLYNPFAGLLA